MPRNALSNRQRKAARKTVAKPGRIPSKPELVVVNPAEPTGTAARAAIIDQVRRADAARLGGDVDLGSAGVDALAGFIQAAGRDGLVLLFRSKALSADQLKAGIAFRMTFVAANPSLGSCLGRAGEGGAANRWGEAPPIVRCTDGELRVVRGAAELQRAYLLARLNQMERAVGGVLVDGRELHALRMIAGNGHTVRDVAGASGHARSATVAALVRALDAIATTLRITGQ